MRPPTIQKYALSENYPNESYRGHEELSFGDLELDLESYLRSTLNF